MEGTSLTRRGLLAAGAATAFAAVASGCSAYASEGAASADTAHATARADEAAARAVQAALSRAGAENPDLALGQQGFSPYATPHTAPFALRAQAAKRLLVVVDYQYDFVYGECAMGDIAANIEDDLCAMIEDYQDAGDLVIYTMDTHPADNYAATREGQVVQLHCDPETPGWQLYGRAAELLTPERGAICVRKGTIGSRDLAGVVQGIINQGTPISSIEFAGISTTCRVLHNAIILFNYFPDIIMIMDRKTTTSYTAEMTDQVLERMESWGFVVKW